jgi:phosphoribosylformylglycinamidine (FGAM) synthase-like enzyme
LAEIGRVTERDRLMIHFAGRTLIDLPISRLKEAWLAPLAW